MRLKDAAFVRDVSAICSELAVMGNNIARRFKGTCNTPLSLLGTLMSTSQLEVCDIYCQQSGEHGLIFHTQTRIHKFKHESTNGLGTTECTQMSACMGPACSFCTGLFELSPMENAPLQC